MEVTNTNLINFANGFSTLDDLTGLDFLLSLNDNHDKIHTAVEALSKVIEASKAMKEFQTKGTDLLKQFSEKDAMGEPKMEAVSKDRSSYVLAESTKADFLSKYAALKEEYSKAIDAQEANQKEYRERLGKKA